MGLNLLYLNVVPAEADAELVRGEGLSAEFGDYVSQLLDLLLCYNLGWGCWYLRVEHRTLVSHAWENSAIADLRTAGANHA
jgi:hypothetical protein